MASWSTAMSTISHVIGTIGNFYYYAVPTSKTLMTVTEFVNEHPGLLALTAVQKPGAAPYLLSIYLFPLSNDKTWVRLPSRTWMGE